MVSHPNLPLDVESNDEVLGAANLSPGLTALDQERQASMADEGGISGARMEFQSGMTRGPTSKALASSVPNDWAELFKTQRIGFFVGLVFGVTATALLLSERNSLNQPADSTRGVSNFDDSDTEVSPTIRKSA